MKIAVLFLTSLLTFVIVYSGIKFLTWDLVTSVTPGWHTTIYPPEIVRIGLTGIILFSALVVYLIFSQVKTVLNFLWIRFNDK